MIRFIMLMIVIFMLFKVGASDEQFSYSSTSLETYGHPESSQYQKQTDTMVARPLGIRIHDKLSDDTSDYRKKRRIG